MRPADSIEIAEHRTLTRFDVGHVALPSCFGVFLLGLGRLGFGSGLGCGLANCVDFQTTGDAGLAQPVLARPVSVAIRHGTAFPALTQAQHTLGLANVMRAGPYLGA